MKSRIVSNVPKVVLAYGIVESALDSLIEVSNRYDITVRQVMPSELDTTVYNLLKLAPIELEEYPKDVTPCILMSGLNKSTMNAFLDELKVLNVNVPLRAILTEYNGNWQFNKLFDELFSEYIRISAQ